MNSNDRTSEEEVDRALHDQLDNVVIRWKKAWRQWSPSVRLITRCWLYFAFAVVGLALIGRSAPVDVWSRYQELAIEVLGSSTAAWFLARKGLLRRISGNVFYEHQFSLPPGVTVLLITTAIVASVNFFDRNLMLIRHPVAIAVATAFVIGTFSVLTWLIAYERRHGPVFISQTGKRS